MEKTLVSIYKQVKNMNVVNKRQNNLCTIKDEISVNLGTHLW